MVRGESIQVVTFERSASFNVAVAGRGAGRSADLAEGGGRLPGGSRPSGEPGAVQPRRVGLPRKGTNKCRVAVAGPTRIGEVDGRSASPHQEPALLAPTVAVGTLEALQIAAASRRSCASSLLIML